MPSISRSDRTRAKVKNNKAVSKKVVGFLLNRMCVSYGIVPIMYLILFVGSKTNLNWDKIMNVVAEEYYLLCVQYLCMQSEQVPKIIK